MALLSHSSEVADLASTSHLQAALYKTAVWFGIDSVHPHSGRSVLRSLGKQDMHEKGVVARFTYMITILHHGWWDIVAILSQEYEHTLRSGDQTCPTPHQSLDCTRP